MKTHQACLAIGCSVVFASCAGEPFRAVTERDEPAPEGPAMPGEHAIDPSSLVGIPAKEVAWARKGPSQVAAFDAKTGRVLATTVVGDVVLDMARDESRLLVATSKGKLEESTVRAFELTEDGLSFQKESEPLGPGARLFPFPPFTLVLTEDMAVIWTLLDAELAPVAPGKAVGRPASLVLSRVHGQNQLLALGTSGFDAGQYFDTLITASFHAGWQLDFESIVAPGRPSSRLASASTRDEVYLVRKRPDDTTFDVADLSGPSPDFRSVAVPGALGAIEATVVDPERESLIVLLSRQASTGALVLVPLRAGVAPVSSPLSAPVEASEWFTRSLALSPTGKVLAATTKGIEVFELSGSAEAPALASLPTFEVEGLVGPLIVQ